jgi:hypothetical protein
MSRRRAQASLQVAAAHNNDAQEDGTRRIHIEIMHQAHYDSVRPVAWT